MVFKIELHVHLEGTISPQLARVFSQKHRLVLSNELMNAPEDAYLSRDFLHFLSVFDTVAALIKSPEDYYTLTYDYLMRSAKEGVIYVELMYSPDHAEKITGIPSSEHLIAIHAAIIHAERDFGIIARVITTIVRHFGVEAALGVVNQAIDQAHPIVVGIGMGGDELGYPPQLFQKAFQRAHDAGFFCTVHSGEFAPAGGMMDALMTLPIQRIGHGVQSIHSTEVLSILKDRQIALELCPSSNVKFGLFSDLSKHPLPKFLEYGIPISINSDDPPFIPTTVGQEYERVQTVFGYSDEQMNQITQMAIHHSFAEPDIKQKIIARLEGSV